MEFRRRPIGWRGRYPGRATDPSCAYRIRTFAPPRVDVPGLYAAYRAIGGDDRRATTRGEPQLEPAQARGGERETCPVAVQRGDVLDYDGLESSRGGRLGERRRRVRPVMRGIDVSVRGTRPAPLDHEPCARRNAAADRHRRVCPVA